MEENIEEIQDDGVGFEAVELPEEIFNEPLESIKPNTSGFDEIEFFKRELGTDVIYTGENADIPRAIAEMTPKERLSALKYHYESKSPKLNDDEFEFLELVRQGNYESLYNELGNHLGKNEGISENYLPTEIEDNTAIIWKLKTDFPDFTDEQLLDRMEMIKQSATYDIEVDNYKKQYSNYANAYNQQLEEQERNILKQEIESNQTLFLEAANSMTDIYGFNISDDLKEKALADILEFNEDGISPFVEFVDKPEGMLYAATLLRALPEISDYVAARHDEIDMLKKEIEKLKPVNNTQTYFEPETNERVKKEDFLERLLKSPSFGDV